MIGAIDIGGTKIAVGVVNDHGRLLAWREFPTEAEKGFQYSLDRMTSTLHQVSVEAGREIQAIGVGCTGPVFPELGTIGNVDFLPGWQGADLAGELSRLCNVPVALENDADAAALGEWAWGVGRGASSFILVTVGTGIGAGLILGGKLYRGVDGSHPEMGHHIVDPSGPACSCGAHGCWESLASGSAMESWAQTNHPLGNWLSARQLCQAAEQGDSTAKAAVARTARFLGIGLANLVTLFSPEVIALGGGLLQSFSLFQDTIVQTIRTSCGLVPHEKVRLAPATLGAQAGLIGAAQAWLSRNR